MLEVKGGRGLVPSYANPKCWISIEPFPNWTLNIPIPFPVYKGTKHNSENEKSPLSWLECVSVALCVSFRSLLDEITFYVTIGVTHLG